MNKETLSKESLVIKAKLDLIRRGYPKNRFYLDLFVDDKSSTVRKAVSRHARPEHLAVLVHDPDPNIRQKAKAKLDAIVKKYKRRN